MYLFHLPLVLLFLILFQDMGPGIGYFLATIGATLAVVVPLGAVTERQKDRLKDWLSRKLPSLGPLARPG